MYFRFFVVVVITTLSYEGRYIEMEEGDENYQKKFKKNVYQKTKSLWKSNFVAWNS